MVLSVVCVMLTLVIYCMCIGVLAVDCGIVRCMCYVDLSYLLYVYWCIGCRLVLSVLCVMLTLVIYCMCIGCRLWYCLLYVLC